MADSRLKTQARAARDDERRAIYLLLKQISQVAHQAKCDIEAAGDWWALPGWWLAVTRARICVVLAYLPMLDLLPEWQLRSMKVALLYARAE